MPRLSLYYPVRPYRLTQRFGENIPCVKDFGLPTQKVVDGTQTTCPMGYDKLYQKWDMAGHNGDDLQAGVQPVYAAVSGTVIEQQTVPSRGLGLGILTDSPVSLDEHGEHYAKVRYWHLQSFKVGIGAHVEAGQQIGVTDSTGYSSGNHLHFELQPMDKDSGGHPRLALQNSGTSVIANAIDPTPFFNDMYADTVSLSNADKIAALAATAQARGDQKTAQILWKLVNFLKAFGLWWIVSIVIIKMFVIIKFV